MRRKSRRASLTLSLAGALLLVTALALGWTWSHAVIADDGDTVAVLPFEVADGAHLEALAAALPVLLSHELGNAGWQVLEARSLRDSGPRWEDQIGMARELGASTVVTGQVIAAGDSMSVLVATVSTSGPPVPRAWSRVVGAPGDLAAMAAALGRQLREGHR